MTQRFFSNEQYEVFTGWDRPLQMHYLDIYSRDPEGVTGDEHGMIFSSLLMDNPRIRPDAIEGKLASYGIPIPATLRQDLVEDQAQNLGNLHVNYDLGIIQDMEPFETTIFPERLLDIVSTARNHTMQEVETPSNLLVTRVRELAERVQGWFHARDRDQDRGMDR
jgi:hypothetical protein